MRKRHERSPEAVVRCRGARAKAALLVLAWGTVPVAVVGGDPPGPFVSDFVATWLVPNQPEANSIQAGAPDVPSIPADFFGPGSDPFVGLVPFEGNPLDPGITGDASVEIRRLGDPVLPADPPGAMGTIPIEIVALELRSIEPITVTFNGGQNPELWDLDITLSNADLPAQGILTATKTHDNGGTFTADFFVQPVYIFTKVADPGQMLIIDTFQRGLPPNHLVIAAADFVHEVSPDLDIILPLGLSEWVPGVKETVHGDINSQVARPFTALSDGGGITHTVCPATPKEAPNNNFCSDRRLIDQDVPTAFDTSVATTDGLPTTGLGDCAHFGDPQIYNDIWYNFTPPADFTYDISLCGSSYDTKMVVYNGCACPADPATEIACNDDFCGLQSQVKVPLLAGVCYTIRVGGFQEGDGGTGLLNIEKQGAITPCCFPDGTCDIVLVPDCLAAGIPVAICLGDNNGNGTDDACENHCVYEVVCIDGNCAACPLHNPGQRCYRDKCVNTCPEILPATCGGPDCCVELMLLGCQLPEGAAPCPDLGDQCTCDPTDGVCCFADGTCEILTEPRCRLFGGVYIGDGTVCLGDSDGNGFDDACEVQACCFDNGTCVNLAPDLCTAFGGTLSGTGTTCRGDNDGNGIDDICETQACCLLGGIVCENLQPNTCVAIGGTPAGTGTVCRGDIDLNGLDDVCETQSCCFGDGSCMNLSPNTCIATGGTPGGTGTFCFGDIDMNGIDDACEVQACCFSNGTCLNLSPIICIIGGGFPQLTGTLCAGDSDMNGIDDACEQQACCFLGGLCSNNQPNQCAALGGTSQGTGTGCAGDFDTNMIDDICEAPEACCLPGGACVNFGSGFCEFVGGTPQGPGTVCIGDTNVNGVDDACELPEACCFPDGSCLLVGSAICAILGGTPQGPATVCAGDGDGNGIDDACEGPGPVGCCFSNGTCVTMPAANCALAGGSAVASCLGDTDGDGNNDACVPPPPSPGDISGPAGAGFPDGCVNAFDLGTLLGAWCSPASDPDPPGDEDPPCEDCTSPNFTLADISGVASVADGCVDAFDLAKLLAEWCSSLGGNPCGTCGP